jgi:CHRD domain-containing protein
MPLRHFALFLAAAMMLAAGAALADTGFSCVLQGVQEVPPNASPATGSGFFILNNAGTTLSYDVQFSGLTANRTAEHFHAPGAPGVNAGVVRTIAGAGATSGHDIGTWNSTDAIQPLTATQVSNLMNGLMYVNVHTANFPGGEIRGQIHSDATPTHPTTWGRIKELFSR